MRPQSSNVGTIGAKFGIKDSALLIKARKLSE